MLSTSTLLHLTKDWSDDELVAYGLCLSEQDHLSTHFNGKSDSALDFTANIVVSF